MLSRKFISKQRKMKKLLLLIIFLSCWTLLPAQLSYGTTGLLHAPSADMQKDKTVMLGGNFLHQELTPPKFNFNTWNYYLNVTIFPFLEVAYTCTLFRIHEPRSLFLRPLTCVERKQIHPRCRAGDFGPFYVIRA